MALVLTRKIGESIVIDSDITVTVLGYDKGQVRLAISAPKEVPVHRLEIQLKVDEEKEQHND